MRRARQVPFFEALTVWTVLVFMALPAVAQDLPGVWFQDARFAVGGDAQEPPVTAEQVCLAWTWTPPEGTVEIYPGATPGTFGKVERTWSLAADGTTVSPESCRGDGSKAAFPDLGVGPGGELWFLKSTGTSAGGTSAGGTSAGGTSAGAWADLLHAAEAAYRQPSPRGDAPLAEITVGTYGSCEIRSTPVDLETGMDRWLPVELPAPPEGSRHVRVRRFLWWMEGASADKGCLAEAAALRLFPVPAPDSESGGEDHLLTVDGVDWKRLRYAELDPDDWSPRVRSAIASTAPAGVTAELTPEQQTLFSASMLTDLCQVRGVDALCRRSEETRRQLFTAVLDPDAEVPWPQARREAVQGACRNALAGRAPADACTAASWWRTSVAGGLVAGFQGDVVLSGAPRIVETWADGRIAWQVEEPEQLAALPELEVDLLDGTRVVVDVAAFQAASRASAPFGGWLFPGLAVLAVVLAVLALLRSRRPAARQVDPARKELLLLIERSVDRRLRKISAGQGLSAKAGPSEDEALREVVQDAVRLLEERAAELEAGLEGHLRRLQASAAGGSPAPQFRAGGSPAPPSGAGGTPAPQLIANAGETPRRDALKALCRDVEALDADERHRFTDALEAAGELGYWIELLWPALQEAADCHLDSIPDSLPEPAGDEWRRARETLESFAAHDAPALRWLRRRLSKDDAPPSTEAVFLESSGLLDSELPFPERLKRYLAPFDHPGRLGEISLALQYLVEAYPVEQLQPARRTRLRKGLAQAVKSVRLEEDFHRLLARAADGVGLVYQPVPYYKSRLDQSEYAFVRQQVTPISLTDRVGFAAATDPAVIVRLDRPFFVQSTNNVYYAGHAHVARG